MDLSFFGHVLNVGKLRYIIFLFQNSKKGHVGYVEDYLHMKGVFLNEKNGLFLILVGILLFTFF
jgi:hypothetical protein